MRPDSLSSTSKPILFDFYCGAGGCTKGYQRAGFYVVGVDINAQPNYCGDEFHRADARDVLEILVGGGAAFGYTLSLIAGCHASPPCQDRSNLKAVNRHVEHVDYVAETRELLERTGLPYVIENVEGNVSGGSALIDPIRLCGSSFGLDVRRHRLFECSFPVMGPPCAHGMQEAKFDVYEHGRWYKSPVAKVYGRGGGKAREHWPAAMGIDWMDDKGLAQAIPPAYTEHIGHYLMVAVAMEAAA